MKVLLIKPHTRSPDAPRSMLKGMSILPPLGLLYIASDLERNGHSVRIFDFDVEKRSLLDILNDIDMVGITSLTPQFPEVVKIATEVKKFDKNIKIVLGGPHATAVAPQIIQNFDVFDYVVRGEGEIIMSKLASGERQIQGVCHKNNINNGMFFVEDLNALSFPARHLVNLKKYKESPFFHRSDPHTTFLSSRGCVFQCIYCDYATRGPCRARSPENVLAELKLLHEEGIRDLRILDECFTAYRKNAQIICELMIKEGLDFSWNCQTRADALDEKTIELMHKAGCYNIQIGVETGSERIMKLINKKLDYNIVRKAIRMAHSYGIRIYGFFMLGFPSETKEDMEKTIEFAKSTDFDMVTFSIVTPYPATKLWEDAGLKSELDLDFLKGLDFYSPKKPFFNVGDMEEIFKEAVRGFYFRPKIALGLLSEVLTKGSIKRRAEYVKFLASQIRGS